MSSLDLIFTALGNLFRRKMRTILTALGVVIGTASILIMISIGLGMERQFEEQIGQYGSLTKVTLYPSHGKEGAAEVYDDEFVDRLKSIEHVRSVVPIVNVRGSLMSGKIEGWAEIMAFDFKYLKDLEIELQEGRMPQPGEALVGKQVSEEFYDWRRDEPKQIKVNPLTDPLEIKIQPREWVEGAEKRKGMKPKIVGIMANEDWDVAQSMYIHIDDYESFMKKYNKRYKVPKLSKKEREKISKYQNIYLFVDDMENMDGVFETLESMEINFHSPGQWLEQAKEQAAMIQNVLGAIGGVSLLVAAIGITNTMVMSIYERTKEIGVMKVIGAKISDIRKLFLLEAGFIGLFGGIIGAALSYGLSTVINGLSENSEDSWGLMSLFSNSHLPVSLILGGIAFAVLIGVLAGLYPSFKATRISALDAIRTD